MEYWTRVRRRPQLLSLELGFCSLRFVAHHSFSQSCKLPVSRSMVQQIVWLFRCCPTRMQCLTTLSDGRYSEKAFLFLNTFLKCETAFCQTLLTCCFLSITIFRVGGDNNKLGTDSEKSHLHSISFSAANTCQGNQELVATTHYTLLTSYTSNVNHTQPLTSATPNRRIRLGELKNVRKGSDCLIGSFVIQFPSPVPNCVYILSLHHHHRLTSTHCQHDVYNGKSMTWSGVYDILPSSVFSLVPVNTTHQHTHTPN